MYYVEQCYRQKSEKDVHTNYDDALAEAQKEASEDSEGYFYYVAEVKAVVKADREPWPTKTIQAADITPIKTLEHDVES